MLTRAHNYCNTRQTDISRPPPAKFFIHVRPSFPIKYVTIYKKRKSSWPVCKHECRLWWVMCRSHIDVYYYSFYLICQTCQSSAGYFLPITSYWQRRLLQFVVWVSSPDWCSDTYWGVYWLDWCPDTYCGVHWLDWSPASLTEAPIMQEPF